VYRKLVKKQEQLEGKLGSSYPLKKA